MTPAPFCAYTVAGGDGMEIWQDGVLAGLAAVGLTAILWLLAGLLFRRGERLLDAVYLVPLSGGAEQLDMTLRELSRERALPVVLVDCGLTAAGRQRAELLTGGAGAVLVTPQQLTDLYTKKENAQGR